MPIALQELPFFADSFEILNDSILIFNGAAFEDQVVLWDYRNKKRINSHLKYDPHYNCRPLKPFTKCNNEILWQREFEQMLYRVTEQELIPARYIDFQEFAYNGKLEKTPQGIYFLQPDIAHMNRYYENDKYIHFIFECEALDDMPFLVYYFKKSGKKPSDFCKENLRMSDVKSYDYVFNYFSNSGILVEAIKEYHRTAKIPKGEYTLLDLLK